MAKDGEVVASKEMIDGAAGLVDTADLQNIDGANTPDNKSTGEPVQPQATTDGDNKDKPVDTIKVDTAFGSNTYGEKGTVLTSWDDMVAFAKDNGVKLEGANDLQGLISEINSLKTKLKDVPALQQKIDTYENQAKTIPNDVAAINQAVTQGGDYMGVIKQIATGNELDFNKHFKDQDVLSLVGRYTGRSLTKESFGEMDQTTRDGLSLIAETKYNDEKSAYTTNIINKQENDQKFATSLNESVRVSIDNLKKRFPDFEVEALKHVENVMATGLKDSLFNPDNTYKPDAAVRIAMQEYGETALQTQEQTIGELAEKIGSRIEGKVNENLILRSNVPDNKGRQADASENEVKKAVDNATHFL